MRDIILFGIQGSGKGTQAKKLQEKLPESLTIDMGSLFRTLTSTDNIIGNYVRDTINGGNLVADSVTASLFQTAVLAAGDRPLIIDGFPRKVGQMYTGLDLLTRLDRNFTAIQFTLDEEIATQRLLQRAAEQGRADDSPEWIAKRFANFHRETGPVISHFKSMGKLIEIDADRSVDEIFADLESKIS